MAEPTAEEIAAKAAADAAAKVAADEAAAKAKADAEAKAKEDEAFDKDRAMATIQKLRDIEKEGKATAKERDELAAKLKELEDAKLSEEERRAKRLAEMESEGELSAVKLKGQAVKLAAYGLQAELGLVDVDLALAALDPKKITWEGDEPTNVKDVLTALLEAKPILKGKPVTTAAGAGGRTDAGAGSSGSGDDSVELTAEELEWCRVTEYDPKKYAKAKKVRDEESYRQTLAAKT
jgi:hypothetical protein